MCHLRFWFCNSNIYFCSEQCVYVQRDTHRVDILPQNFPGQISWAPFKDMGAHFASFLGQPLPLEPPPCFIPLSSFLPVSGMFGWDLHSGHRWTAQGGCLPAGLLQLSPGNTKHGWGEGGCGGRGRGGKRMGVNRVIKGAERGRDTSAIKCHSCSCMPKWYTDRANGR